MAGRNVTEIVVAAVILLVRLLCHELVEQLRCRADIEQAAVRQADLSSRSELIDHGGRLILAERTGRNVADDAAALDLGHAGIREQLGQERASGLPTRVLLLRILEGEAEIDVDAVIDHGHNAVHIVLLLAMFLNRSPTVTRTMPWVKLLSLPM